MKITSKLLMATVVLFAACQKENTTTKTPVHSSDVNVSEAMMREDGNNPDENVLNAAGTSLATGHIYIESRMANWPGHQPPIPVAMEAGQALVQKVPLPLMKTIHYCLP